jgi:3-oxoacyl-[acyl-carrier protein] reductase
MDLGIRDRIALVCGASKGLGKAVALGLAKEGARVAVCSRNKENILTAAAEISKAAGTEVLGIAADLSKAEEARRFFKEALDHFGRVDILVTNAGGPPSLPFAEITDAQWKSAFDLTLMSAIILIRECLPLMKEQRFGRIINITSVAVKQPLEGLILSNALRTGLIGLAKTLSNDFAPFNILINNVCPRRHPDRKGQRTFRGYGSPKRDLAGKSDSGMGGPDPHETDGETGRIGQPGGLPGLRAGFLYHRHDHPGGWGIL